MQFIKDLVKPVDPSYVRWIKGSDNILSEFSGKNAIFDGGGSLAGSIVSNSTTPLKDIRDYKYTSVITSNGDYFGYVFDVPSSLRGNTSVFEFLFKANDNTKFNIVAKDVTNASIIQSTVIPTQNGTSPQYQFVFTIPATCTQVKIGWQYTGSVAGDTFEWDNVVFKLWTPQAVNLIEQESVTYTGYLSGTTGGFRLGNKLPSSNNARIISDDNSTFTKYAILKKSQGVVSFSYDGANGSYISIEHRDSVGNLIRSARDSISSNGEASAVLAGVFNVGDYFKVITNTTGGVPTDGVPVNFSIVASAISENIIQSWQDGTEPTPYTPTFSNFGTVTSPTFTWQKQTKYLETLGQFTCGTPVAASGAISLPTGLQLDAANLTSATIVVGEWTRGAASTEITRGPILMNTANGNTVVWIGQATSVSASGQSPLSIGNANIFGAGERISVKFKVPIYGWSSTPTILALPTSKDNNKTYDKSLVTITSDVTGWTTDFAELYPYRTISKVTGLPIWRLAFNIRGTVTAGTRLFNNITIAGVSMKSNQGFSATTSIISPMYLSTTSTGLYIEHNSGSTIWYTASGDVEINSKPTWADEWIEPGVFVGNVAKNQVAIVQYRSNGSNLTVTTTPVAVPFNAIKGNGNIVSLASNQITLQAGVYELDSCIDGYFASTANGMTHYLYNVSDSSIVDYGITLAGNGGANYYTQGTGKFYLDISSQKTFEYRAVVSTSTAYIPGWSAPADLSAYLKITKLNG